MKVIKRSTTPQDIAIQLEDWENDVYIAAYPIAKASSRFGWVQSGEKFRLTIKTVNPEADFHALESGEKALQDMDTQYWNGERDRYIMGLRDTAPEW